jgi:pyrroline-5-carboxylate reductase
MALKIALVGCGAMGSALLTGWLSLADSRERFATFWVIAPHRERVESFLSDPRVEWHASPDTLQQTPDVIVFAVKPFMLEEVLPSYKAFESLFVSIAAGKPLTFYQKFLNPSHPLVRAMPNTPVMIHQGVTGLLQNKGLNDKQKILVDTCFQGLGYTLWVRSDDDLDKITAISGSGPAYVFAMIEALTQSAASLGFDQKTSQNLALTTFLGASSYAQHSGEPPALLRERVTSPKGTTAAALTVLEKGGLGQLIDAAVKAAYQRAREIAA